MAWARTRIWKTVERASLCRGNWWQTRRNPKTQELWQCFLQLQEVFLDCATRSRRRRLQVSIHRRRWKRRIQRFWYFPHHYTQGYGCQRGAQLSPIFSNCARRAGHTVFLPWWRCICSQTVVAEAILCTQSHSWPEDLQLPNLTSSSRGGERFRHFGSPISYSLDHHSHGTTKSRNACDRMLHSTQHTPRRRTCGQWCSSVRSRGSPNSPTNRWWMAWSCKGTSVRWSATRRERWSNSSRWESVTRLLSAIFQFTKWPCRMARRNAIKTLFLRACSIRYLDLLQEIWYLYW